MIEGQTKINFDATTHTYSDDNGVIYTSVTTLIGKYKPAFNKKYWSMYVALRDTGFKVRPTNEQTHIWVDGVRKELNELYTSPVKNNEVNKVVQEWNRLTEIACARGNSVHDYLEDSINKSKGDVKGKTNELIKPNISLQGELLILRTKHDLDATGVQDRYPIIYARLLHYIKKGCTLFAEKRVCTTTYQVAGMIDVLIVKGRKFAILDWKTNKDVLLFNSGYFQKEWINGEYVKTDKFVHKKEYLYSPLDFVENCKGMIYSLQLNLYAYIMILWGYELVKDGLEIFHIRPDMKPYLVKVPTMQNAIDKMMKHHLNYRVKKDQLTKKTLNNRVMFGIN